jgi:hypothetical protein
MRSGTRGIRIVASIAALCVLAAAGGATAEPATPAKPVDAREAPDLAGRWEGRAFELTRARSDCGDEPCTLTLDVARCADGWCGVEVLGTERRCGGTALRLDGGAANGGEVTLFKGKLALAKGTEPYVVEVYLVATDVGEAKRELQITGDTGGEFRMFRRSFPFNATLVRVAEARCRPETTVSLLD